MACVELPKDAYGRAIPLDTGTLYKKNGIAKYIYYYEFDPRGTYWLAETDEGKRNTSELLLNQPDSWELLEEDLDRCIKADSLLPSFDQCIYVQVSDDRRCEQTCGRNLFHILVWQLGDIASNSFL